MKIYYTHNEQESFLNFLNRDNSAQLRTLRELSSAFPRHDNFISIFNELVIEEKNLTDRTVDIRDLTGISASKSDAWKLDDFRNIIDFNKLFADYKNIENVARSVLEGRYDYVSRRGESVDVELLEWNNCMTVLNTGGSHRFAALRLWHKDNNKPRMLNCTVYSYRLNPKCMQLVRKYNFWIVPLKNEIKFPFWLRPFIRKFYTKLGFCYFCERKWSYQYFFKKRFENFFDLSAYLLRISNDVSVLKI